MDANLARRLSTTKDCRKQPNVALTPPRKQQSSPFTLNTAKTVCKTPTSARSDSDRYIPALGSARSHGNLAEKFNFARIENMDDSVYRNVLVNEILPNCSPVATHISASPTHQIKSAKRILKFTSIATSNPPIFTDSSASLYSSSTLSQASKLLLSKPHKLTRQISKVPYKVLDAPDLQDDFYLNLVDWSNNNYLAVGLSSCVYLWSASTSKVHKLCDLSSSESDPGDVVTSVNWRQNGTHLSIGTNSGKVQIYDIIRQKKIREYKTHTARVGALAWTAETLTSASRDKSIVSMDLRDPRDVVVGSQTYTMGHTQEVCGLKWNNEGGLMASGGNDNCLLVWDWRSRGPLLRITEHVAAVKAIAWSPHQHGLLASGGGTADRSIRVWNTSTGLGVKQVDTGSQVCNLAWSKNSNELVSTHGYSQNQIVVWSYPTMRSMCVLSGHSYRVLYLSVSPCGENIVTGAGDETLRFWSVFGKGRKSESGGVMNVR